MDGSEQSGADDEFVTNKDLYEWAKKQQLHIIQETISWMEKSGESLSYVLSSKLAAEQALLSSSPLHQRAGLAALSMYWGADTHIQGRILELLNSHIEAGCCDAESLRWLFGCIRTTFIGSFRKDLARRIAWLVLDQNLPVALRESAYLTVEAIMMRSIEYRERHLAAFKFPENMDAALIRRLTK